MRPGSPELQDAEPVDGRMRRFAVRDMELEGGETLPRAVAAVIVLWGALFLLASLLLSFGRTLGKRALRATFASGRYEVGIVRSTSKD